MAMAGSSTDEATVAGREAGRGRGQPTWQGRGGGVPQVDGGAAPQRLVVAGGGGIGAWWIQGNEEARRPDPGAETARSPDPGAEVARRSDMRVGQGRGRGDHGCRWLCAGEGGIGLG